MRQCEKRLSTVKRRVPVGDDPLPECIGQKKFHRKKIIKKIPEKKRFSQDKNPVKKNEEIYCERLGYTREDLGRLREGGII